MTVSSAIVFGYHNVGVRCLRVLLDAGIDVRLVVTHEDSPGETIWFGSVAEAAREHGVAVMTPDDANTTEVLEACRAAAPDFLFSFYYRKMLKAPLLAVPRRGAYNLHGSLLPRYRGRAPVNWAVLHGERETGATLHAMDERPDHGAIVDQCAVPILIDDTARDAFDKVTVAAEIVVARSVPRLVDGTAVLTPQDFSKGGYFGGRKPEDGRIAAQASARNIHDLVRAVAPPDYPGAFFDTPAGRVLVARTRLAPPSGRRPAGCFELHADDGTLRLTAVDGATLQVLDARLDGAPLDAAACAGKFGTLSPAI
ncbi:MAG: formyltransferase [Proteobacteria bacterium]|nr:formyltransferase [Pseudomonadota bacterium]